MGEEPAPTAICTGAVWASASRTAATNCVSSVLVYSTLFGWAFSAPSVTIGAPCVWIAARKSSDGSSPQAASIAFRMLAAVPP